MAGVDRRRGKLPAALYSIAVPDLVHAIEYPGIEDIELKKSLREACTTIADNNNQLNTRRKTSTWSNTISSRGASLNDVCSGVSHHLLEVHLNMPS